MSRSPEFQSSPSGLSKRAAQRLIQRAVVLAARSRNVKQHIREADLTSIWLIADWDLEWAVTIRRGRLDFDRRVPRQPDIRVTWPTAEEFFAQAEKRESTDLKGAQYEGPLQTRRTWEVVFQAFRVALGDLLKNPVDEDGTSLV